MLRKLVALSLIFVLSLTLFGCSEKTYQLAWDGFCYTASDSPMDLESNEKKYIIGLLNEGAWETELSNCDCDYYFVTQKQRIQYHSECGMFNDITNGKVLKITEEQRLKINSFLVGESEK